MNSDSVKLSRRQLGVLALSIPVLSACTSEKQSAGDTTSRPSPAPGTAASAARLDTLRIRHPSNLAFAAPFAMMAAQNSLGAVADNIDIDVWTTPDVLRSMLVNGQSDVTAVPTYVGATLVNRGIEVQMAAVVVWGLLWVLGPDGTPANWESLRGRTIMIPFRNDMPDLVFQRVAQANGLTPGEDFTVEYYAQPPEVVSRLVSGQGAWAVLPEHTATLALTQVNRNGGNLVRVLDLQQEWAAATGGQPRIPQAGIVVPRALAAEHPEVISVVLTELEEAVATVNERSPSTVETLARASDVPGPIVQDAIPRLNLEIVPAGAARPELEAFFTELSSMNTDIIGGQLPPASFYLDDPR